jgi:hypothetical protein
MHFHETGECADVRMPQRSRYLPSGRLGLQGYNDETELDWLRAFTADAVDVDAFMDNGGVRFPPRPDAAAFAKQIRNPERHRFTAPCKIEVHSMALAANPAVELGAARQRQNRGIRGDRTLGARYASCRERRTT